MLDVALRIERSYVVHVHARTGLYRMRKYVASLLICAFVDGLGIIDRQEGHLAINARSAKTCEDLEKLPHAQVYALSALNETAGQTSNGLAFSCHVGNSDDAHNNQENDDSEASCSPVCMETLDIVVVLGTSEWSLDESDANYLRQSSIDLLKHFDLGQGRGSLFGFVDVSRGVKRTQMLTPLNDRRSELIERLESWRPQLGGKAVTALDLQGFEQRSEVLSMLNISRSKVRRTLLVMQLPPRASPSAASSSSLFLEARHRKTDPFRRDREIMEMLVSACPAIRIDPSMQCGRMRWGKGDTADSEKMNPWGSHE